MSAEGQASDDARGALRFATFFFVLSGAAALVYQVAWQRLLALTTGVGVYSVAIITSAFLAGLGIGSHAGGLVSRRLSPRRSLQAFGVIELAIAAFAAGSVPLYYGLLYARAPALYDGLGRATVTHFLTLLPPTALMGMSLPFLVRGLVRDRDAAPRTIGLLYGANALGAAVGAALTPWLLLRFLGVTGAVLVGAAGSGLAGIGGLLLASRLRGDAPTASPAKAEPVATGRAEAARPFQLWLALYALSGFVALSLEIVWFRVLDVTAKGAAFTFGTLLALYLTGLAAGTFVSARRASGVRRPLAAFLACQAGIVLTTVLAHALLVWLPADLPGLARLSEYTARSVGVQMEPLVARDFTLVYLALPLVLFGPATFLMGLGFPILQRATQADPVLSGHRVGLLQAANIAGCVAGSLVTGLLLIDLVGTAGVFRALAALAALMAGAGVLVAGERRLAAPAAALLVLALAFPGNERLWLRLHGNQPLSRSLVEEDAASVTALTPEPDGDRYKLWVNGRQNSWLPYGWLHTVIGAVPALVHPSPQDVAIVGLGSGDTAWASGCREETRAVTVFEIASSQPRLLARVAGQPQMGRLQAFLADPRVAIVPDDGRRRLRADGRRYDVIALDMIWHDGSLSTYLYSTEWFRIVRDSLRPGGLACILARTPRIRASFRRAFPYVIGLGENLVVASAEPIPLDREGWIARARSERVMDYLGKARAREVAAFLARGAPERAVPPTAEVNRDLQPNDEFLRPLATRF
jgi:predicted membrane-bound spermidine synthase